MLYGCYYNRCKNTCLKILPAHSMITKRDFNLHGSYFCGNYIMATKEKKSTSPFYRALKQAAFSAIMLAQNCFSCGVLRPILLNIGSFRIRKRKKENLKCGHRKKSVVTLYIIKYQILTSAFLFLVLEYTHQNSTMVRLTCMKFLLISLPQ